MDRRNAIITLSGVLATTAVAVMPRRAFAQPALPNTGELITPSQYRSQTLAAGGFAKQTSTLAVSKASHPGVKQFAQFEVAEQTTIGQVLTDTANPPLPPLDQEHAALLGQLQAKSGKDFDVAYVDGQIAGHHALLNIQQTFLDGVTTERDYQHIAMLARTVIQMHLTMLQDLQNQLTA